MGGLSCVDTRQMSVEEVLVKKGVDPNISTPDDVRRRRGWSRIAM